MHPVAIELIFRLAENAIPVITGMGMSHIRGIAKKEIIKSYSENIAKQQKILSQHNYSNKSPQKVDFHHEKVQKLESIEAPFVEVPHTNDLDQLHAEKWNEYFEQIYDLNDNAGTGTVVKAMKKI